MRTILPLLFGTAAVLGTVSAAPVPKDAGKPVLYYPTEIGTKIEYKDETETTTSRAGEIVSAETTDGVTTITLEWGQASKQDGAHVVKEKVAVSAKGVFRVSLDGTELMPPMCLLKLPVKKGDKWDTTFTSGGTKSVGSATAGEPEEVKTPAGKFTAVPVEHEYTIGKVTQRMTHWYAPQVGLVQESFVGYKRNDKKLIVLKTLQLPKP